MFLDFGGLAEVPTMNNITVVTLAGLPAEAGIKDI